jgi:catechol-2,3-dioxygenase
VEQLWVDHLVFRVRSLSETERFYTALLNLRAQEYTDSIMYQVADIRIFFTTAATGLLKYDKEQIGLNHLAFGV